MAIPSNYIDKIKKEGESRPICPPADHVRVNNENFEADNLDEVLDQVAEAIDEAADGYNPPADGIPKTDLSAAVQESLNLADSSLQPSDKAQLQGAITQLQNALNTLIGSGNVQGAIDTFNEVTAFLNGIDTDDPTLANQLLSLSSAISALQTAINNVYTKTESDGRYVRGISVNGGAAQTPNNGNVNLVIEAGGLTEEDIDVSSNQDGTVDFTFGESSYTINLNHTHPQYVVIDELDDYIIAGTNVTITKDSQTGALTINASGGSGGGITGITMNGSSVTVNNGVADLGTVLTSHQSLSGYAKYVLLADEAAYTALATKDSNTLYLIPES